MNIFNSIVKPAHAVINNPLLRDSQQQVNAPVSFFNNVLQTIITIFLFVGVLYFLWHFIMNAYHMISSAGDAKKFEEARNGLTYSLLGIIIAFSVFAILKFIGTVFGIGGLDTLNLTLPRL